jgi:hypothetical protein
MRPWRVRQHRVGRTRRIRQEEQSHQQPGPIGQPGDRSIRAADRDQRRDQAPHDPADQQRRAQAQVVRAARHRQGQGDRCLGVAAPDRHGVGGSADELPHRRRRDAFGPPVAVDGDNGVAVAEGTGGRAVRRDPRCESRSRPDRRPAEAPCLPAVHDNGRGNDGRAGGDDRAQPDRQHAEAGPFPERRHGLSVVFLATDHPPGAIT